MHILSYLLHFSKSKRRHGTHSPFVYEYADKVLHQFPGLQIPWHLTRYQLIQKKLLQATIPFLNPNYIHWTGMNAPFNSTGSEPGSGSKYQHLLQNQPLLIAAQVENVDLLREDPIIITLNPYQDKISSQAWRTLCENSRFSLTLDLWYMGILIESDIFKQKSHFKLI